MTNRVNPLENEADQILANSINTFFEEDKEESEEKVENDEPSSSEPNDNDLSEEEEIKEDEEGDIDKEEDVEEEEEPKEDEENELDKKEFDLDKELRGVFSKDYINLLKSVEDPVLRNDLIEAGKSQRADVDRKMSEIGASKKIAESLEEAIKSNNLNYHQQQYPELIKNYIGFDALYTKDPALAIKNLAEQANIDLNKLIDSPVEDVSIEDEYRTPEEIARDKKLETLEKELHLIKNQKQNQEAISAKQELYEFSITKDDEGKLKYPHFERVRKNMGIFFNESNPNMTLEKAYNKSILLDDELISQRDEYILKKAERKRKEEIVKAKKLQKQSVRSSKVKATMNDPDKALEKLVNDFFG